MLVTGKECIQIAFARSTLKYGSEVCEPNNAQIAALESVALREAKHILSFIAHLGLVMRLTGGTWDWILYRVVGIRQSRSVGNHWLVWQVIGIHKLLKQVLIFQLCRDYQRKS